MRVGEPDRCVVLRRVDVRWRLGPDDFERMKALNSQPCWAAPAFADGQSNSVVVDAARQVESRCQSLAEWEVTPGGNVERTDDASGVLHGTAAPDADSGYGRLRLGEQALAQALEGIEQLLCVGRAWRRDAGGGEELASCIDNGRAQLGAADVDCQDGRIRHGVAPQGARRGSYPDCDPREC